MESTLALTANGPGLGEGSATCRLGGLGRSLSCCHGQGHSVAQLQGQPLAAVDGVPALPGSPSGSLLVAQRPCLLHIRTALQPHGTCSVSQIWNCWEGIYWSCCA